MGGILTLQGAGAAGTILPPDRISANLIRWGDPRLMSLGTLASYTDRSGQGNAFTASGAQRPTVIGPGINGRQSLQWDGANTFISCAALGAALSGSGVPFTFGVVAQLAALPSAGVHNCLFIAANSGGAESAVPTHDLFYYTEGYNLNSDRRDNSGLIVSSDGYTIDTSPHVIIYDFDGTTGNIYVDGTLTGSFNQFTGAFTVDNFAYGAHARTGVNDSFFNGLWGEDVLYSPNLGATKVQQLQTYLAGQWGLSGQNYPWSPYLLGGVQAWLSELSMNVPADNATVTRWSTRVVGASQYDFTDNGTGNIKYHAAGMNGMGCCQLDGTNYWIKDAIASTYLSGSNKPFTVAGAFQATDLANSGEWFAAGRGASNTPLHRVQIANVAGGNTYVIDRRDDSNSLKEQTAGTPDTNLHTMIHSFDGSNVTLILDGVTLLNGADLSTGSVTLDRFTLGAFRRTSTSENFVGKLGEFIFANQATTGGDLTSLKNYLKRWGVG
jgi:hypothetical protein